jgi:hypothetical protein
MTNVKLRQRKRLNKGRRSVRLRKEMLQKIADLDSIIDLLKSDLDEMRVFAAAGD